MPNRPANPNDPPNPPDVTVEAVLGAQVGNPPILPMDESAVEGQPEPPEGALINEVVPQPPPPPTQA